MKRYLMPILIIILVLISGLVGCGQEGSPKAVEIEVSEPRFVRSICPEGVSPEEWYDYLEFDCGFLGRHGAFPDEIFSPHRCVEVSEIKHREKILIGEAINISIKSTPNACLDLRFEYPVKGGRNRIEWIEYVDSGQDGSVNVSWLASEDISFSISSPAQVSLSIYAYPPLRAYYKKGHDWRKMRIATRWHDSFFIYP